MSSEITCVATEGGLSCPRTPEQGFTMCDTHLRMDIADLEGPAPVVPTVTPGVPLGQTFAAKFNGMCKVCGQRTWERSLVVKTTSGYAHLDCARPYTGV